MNRLIASVKASPEERARRLSICEECEWAKLNTMTGKDIPYCGACGCPLASRTYFKHVHCPKGKW